MQDRNKYVDEAVEAADTMVWDLAFPPRVLALPLGTSAQKPELTALTQALKLAKANLLTSAQTANKPLLQLMFLDSYIKEGGCSRWKESKIRTDFGSITGTKAAPQRSHDLLTTQDT